MGNRIYYAIQQAGIRSANQATASTAFTAIHGLQDISLNTNFTTSPVPTLGQSSVHTILEDNYEVTVSLNKVLDGYPLIYTLATSDTSYATLPDRLVQRCELALSIFDDSLTCATGNPVATMKCRDMSVASLKYNFDSKSNFTEEISLVGADKLWTNDARIVNTNDLTDVAAISFSGAFSNTDTPLAVGGVNRRQDFLFNGANGDTSILPTDILGVDSTGQPTNAHISRAAISVNVNYNVVPFLGRKTPFCRLPNFPLEITSEFSVTPISGDGISATETGILSVGTACISSGNIGSQLINIATCEGTRIGLGNQNKLSAISYQGGGPDGGYVTTNYTYKTFDTCTILHQNDASHTDFWADRDSLLVPSVSVSASETGVYALQWDNFGVPTTTLTITGYPLASTGIPWVNMRLGRSSDTITGVLIEEQVDKLNGVLTYNTDWISIYSGITCGAGCTLMLFNIYPTIITSGATSDLSIYQYRARGIYGGNKTSNATSEITINVSY